MSVNQIFFVVGAIILLGVLSLPAHRVSLLRTEILMATEATSVATALGQALLEEIIVKKFDENKCGLNDTTSNAADFSSTLSIDAGSGDTSGNIATYDDVDDFNGYTKTVATSRLGNYVDSVKVYYVAEDAPDAISGSRTFLKRIDVKVRNPYLATLSSDSTVTISKVISYRYKGG